FPRQTEGHPCINQIAEEHPQGRPRNHLGEYEMGRELQTVRVALPSGIRNGADQDHHNGDIVEHQPEESVDVTPFGPAVTKRGWLCHDNPSVMRPAKLSLPPSIRKEELPVTRMRTAVPSKSPVRRRVVSIKDMIVRRGRMSTQDEIKGQAGGR